MIMYKEYLYDLMDYIRDMPDALFDCNSMGLSKETVLSDKDLMDKLWTSYQKSVEEYDCDPGYAFRDTMHEILGIPEQLQSDDDGQQPEKHKVTVVVAGGMVTAAFTDAYDIDFDVIDLDDADMSDDETRDKMYREVDRLEKELRKVW